MRKKLIILFFFISFIGFSQTNLVPYSHDYEFAEGLFLTINQLKNNSPIPKSSIISKIPKSDIDFLKQEIQQKNIVYRDTSNYEHTIETSDIWGYCQNRTFYINYNNEFNRVNVIGTLFQFTALVKTTVNVMNPMYSNYGLNTTVEELRQFVLDTQTNKIYSFDVNDMSILLKNDPELYNQFMALSNRKKSDSQFIYLRKYNEKHPLLVVRY